MQSNAQTEMKVRCDESHTSRRYFQCCVEFAFVFVLFEIKL